MIGIHLSPKEQETGHKKPYSDADKKRDSGRIIKEDSDRSALEPPRDNKDRGRSRDSNDKK